MRTWESWILEANELSVDDLTACAEALMDCMQADKNFFKQLDLNRWVGQPINPEAMSLVLRLVASRKPVKGYENCLNYVRWLLTNQGLDETDMLFGLID